MIFAPEHNQEEVRLKALQALNILDSSSDVRYDLLAEFTAEIFQVPICSIAFMDSDRLWFKSVVGADIKEIPRDTSICGHTICNIKSRLPKERIMEIPNTKNDLRFFDNPLVTEAPHVHSYLAYALQAGLGQNIGTFSIIDTNERIFTKADYEKLIFLGNMVENLIHGRDILCGIISDAH